jgi:hypothetical protein
MAAARSPERWRASGRVNGRSYRALVASVTGPTPEERLISGPAQVERIERDVWISPFAYFVNRIL